jgi:hypothetical protein
VRVSRVTELPQATPYLDYIEFAPHCCLAALRWESHQMLKKSKKRHQERKREVHNTQFGSALIKDVGTLLAKICFM